MCFSLLASVTAGAALCAAGALTLALARERGERPLASIPLLFGVQQLVEGLVWWSLDHHDATVNVASTSAYMLFSHVLWPVYVPFAVLCMESSAWRRKAITACLAVGALVSLDGILTVLRGPSTSHVVGSSIRYETPGLLVIGLYLLATCVAVMVSSHRPLQLIGAAALALALVTLGLYSAVFVSVWCFFSAVLTVMIFVYFWARARSRSSVLV